MSDTAGLEKPAASELDSSSSAGAQPRAIEGARGEPPAGLPDSLSNVSAATRARAESGRLRVLVAIASYGTGHLELLKRIIRNYHSMPFDCDIVVLSEAPKELGPEVEVRIGLPANNPMALPFAHKALFAERADRYDLFIYTEDDNEVTERHIRAFVELSGQLRADEIAGFLRYEIYPDGGWHMDEVFAHYHWKPESVGKRGRHVVAEFTNEHAGYFILTQKQLKRAIASGGFLVEPYEGAYYIRETAATDPYTRCGFRKVIGISAIEDFLIHHADNRYVGWHNVSLESFKEQIGTLMSILGGAHPASSLFDGQIKTWHGAWQKSYYEKPDEELLSMVPPGTPRVLSIGCGWGAAEAELSQRGATVTVLPLDSVIGAVAARRGLEVIYGSWPEGLAQLGARRFDCVLLTNLLHLQTNPERILAECAARVADSGCLVVSGPNFTRAPSLLKRVLGQREFAESQSPAWGAIRCYGAGSVLRDLRRAGFSKSRVRWHDQEVKLPVLGKTKLRLGRLSARNWTLKAWH
jgi:SAM-dependent methyltransferase